jgi:hypothetical protein
MPRARPQHRLHIYGIYGSWVYMSMRTLLWFEFVFYISMRTLLWLELVRCVRIPHASVLIPHASSMRTLLWFEFVFYIRMRTLLWL